jgi:hypothetical protein
MKGPNTETTSCCSGIKLRHGIGAAMLSLALLVSGCGGSGGGGGSSPAAVNNGSTTLQESTANSFRITGDSYGVENVTYLAATKSASSIVLRAAVAVSMNDPDFKTVARIDITTPQAVSASGAYSLGAATGGLTPFAGAFYLFNGHQSTLLRTTGGTISFTRFGADSGDRISGSFAAIIEDDNDSTLPKASYTVAGNFDFILDSVGPVLPAVAAVSPTAAVLYQGTCASCHKLGSLDQTGSAPDLSLRGGRIDSYFTADVPSHQGITLAASDIVNLKVLLNVN